MTRPYTKRSPKWDYGNPPAETPEAKQETPETMSVITFEDLPADIQRDVNAIIVYRKNIGLPDDSVDRKERAISYHKFKIEQRSKE